MAKVLITYFSKTGNTEKMALAIAEGMQKQGGVEVIVRKIHDVSPQEWLKYDAVVMGSPVYYGGPAAEIKKAIDESVSFHGKMRGKIGGAFASSANVGGGNETTILDILHAWLIHGMIVAGEPFGDHFGPVSIGAPDKRARECCLDYGKMIAELAAKMFP